MSELTTEELAALRAEYLPPTERPCPVCGAKLREISMVRSPTYSCETYLCSEIEPEGDDEGDPAWVDHYRKSVLRVEDWPPPDHAWIRIDNRVFRLLDAYEAAQRRIAELEAASRTMIYALTYPIRTGWTAESAQIRAALRKFGEGPAPTEAIR